MASHSHDAASCTNIMVILADADEAQDLSQPKAPTGMAFAVKKGISSLDALTDGMDRGEAFVVASNSKSLIKHKSRRSTTQSTRPR